MPVFRLTDQLVFPDPDLAEDGLLAVGGDLSVPRLLQAYRCGIFPWFGEDDPLLWWSPSERAVLRPGELHLSVRTRRSLRQRPFEVRFDTAFEAVIGHCSRVPRPGQDGTWITDEMRAAYLELHHAGHAHSVEAWWDGRLCGGLYGVSIGGAFLARACSAWRPRPAGRPCRLWTRASRGGGSRCWMGSCPTRVCWGTASAVCPGRSFWRNWRRRFFTEITQEIGQIDRP